MLRSNIMQNPTCWVPKETGHSEWKMSYTLWVLVHLFPHCHNWRRVIIFYFSYVSCLSFTRTGYRRCVQYDDLPPVNTNLFYSKFSGSLPVRSCSFISDTVTCILFVLLVMPYRRILRWKIYMASWIEIESLNWNWQLETKSRTSDWCKCCKHSAASPCLVFCVTFEQGKQQLPRKRIKQDP